MPARARVSAPWSKGLNRMRLCRLEQDVALFAERQLDDTFTRKLGRRQDHLFVSSYRVVDPQPATLDLTARLAIRRDKPRPDENREHTEAGLEFRAGNFYRWKIFRDCAFLESLPGGFGGGFGGIA